MGEKQGAGMRWMWEEKRMRIAANSAGDGRRMKREAERWRQRHRGNSMWRAQSSCVSFILRACNAAPSMLSTAQQSSNLKAKKAKRRRWRGGGGGRREGREEKGEEEEGGGESWSSAAADGGERQVAGGRGEGGALQQHAIST